MPPSIDQPDLLALARVVRNRWWVIAVTTAASLAIVGSIVVMTETAYEADARVLLATSRIAAASGVTPASFVMAAEIEHIEGDTIVGEIRRTGPAGARVSAVEASPYVVQFVGRAAEPGAAASAADHAAASYLSIREAQLLDEIAATRAATSAALDAIRTELDSVTSSGADHGGEPAASALVTAEAELITRDADLAILASIIEDRGVGVVQSAARTPSDPVAPQAGRDLAAAFVAGLVLGVTIVFVAHHLES